MSYTIQDHFYVCITHLKDKGFASPIIDLTEAAAKKKKEELDREIALVIKEYEERVKKKAKDKKNKKEDGKDEDKKDKKKEEDEDVKALKEKDDKVRSETVRPITVSRTHQMRYRSKPSTIKVQQKQQKIRLEYILYKSCSLHTCCKRYKLISIQGYSIKSVLSVSAM